MHRSIEGLRFEPGFVFARRLLFAGTAPGRSRSGHQGVDRGEGGVEILGLRLCIGTAHHHRTPWTLVVGALRRRQALQGFIVDAARIRGAAQGEQRVRLGFEDIGRKGISRRTQRLHLVHGVLPALAITQGHRTVALQTRDQTRVRRRGGTRLAQQRVETGQRRVHGVETPSGIGLPRRDVDRPAQALAGDAAAHTRVGTGAQRVGGGARGAQLHQHISQGLGDFGVVWLQAPGLRDRAKGGIAIACAQRARPRSSSDCAATAASACASGLNGDRGA